MALTEAQEIELLRLLEEDAREREFNKLAYIYPDTGPLRRELYPKFMQLFDESKNYREINTLSGNGVGKTHGVGAYLTTLHATGLYPKWWKGKRFSGPIDAWCAGDTRETTRDIVQAKLFGDVAKKGDGAYGTGLIPLHLLGKPKVVSNTGGAFDYVPVKHVSGGWSVIGLKSYEQGRKAFQGTEKHWVWADEEPPEDVYVEMLMRGRTVDGQALTTFTPLSGKTPLVTTFLNWRAENAKGASKFSVMCSMDEVPHLSETEKTELLAGVPHWQRQARRSGAPTVGTGLVYPVDEAQFVIRPVRIESYWRKGFAFDYGIKATAWGMFAVDDDTDTVYLYKDYKAGDQPIPVHAAALKAQGAWIRGVGDASARDSDGASIVAKYNAQGVKMQLAKKGPGSLVSGIEAVHERLVTGRFKIFSTCTNTLEEIRNYAFDEKGNIKKENDHNLDTCRYFIDGGGMALAATEKRASRIYCPEVSFG